MTMFAKNLTDAQFKLARRIEAAGLATLSQAVKAIERNETAKIEAWKAALAAKQS